jgi:hypothetical protein
MFPPSNGFRLEVGLVRVLVGDSVRSSRLLEEWRRVVKPGVHPGGECTLESSRDMEVICQRSPLRQSVEVVANGADHIGHQRPRLRLLGDIPRPNL